jgi:hypothetical protein
MILDTQKAMRAIQKLPFCYLCGEPMADPRTTTMFRFLLVFLLKTATFRSRSRPTSNATVIGRLKTG